MRSPSTTPLPVGSRVEVTIDSLAAGGDGVARVDGCVVFVPESVPRDRALVEIVAVGPNHARARVVELREPASDRRTPLCAHFGRCGGCAWQHVAIEAQRAAKVEIVRNALTRIGGIEVPPPIRLIAAAEFGWRARAVLKVVKSQGVQRVGFQRAASHEVEVIDDCPVLVDALRSEVRALAGAPDRVPHKAQRLLLAAGDDRARVVFVDERAQPLGTATEDTLVEQTIGGLHYVFDTHAFFQGHRALIESLVEAAIDGASGGTALDLYCGAGLFTLPLARAFERVVGVEADRHAIGLARANAQSNGIANVRFERGDVESILDSGTLPRDVDFVLLDPPRAGAGERIVERVTELRPRAVHYVSCDPATLARDIKSFRARGFELDAIAALDMFPQTPHVECVARLRATKSP